MSRAYDMAGRAVDASNPSTLAIGLYYYHPPGEEPVDSPCGSLRSGFMVVNHNADESGVIGVCNGTTTTAHLPDIYLTDDAWKPYILWVIVAACLAMVFSIGKTLLK